MSGSKGDTVIATTATSIRSIVTTTAADCRRAADGMRVGCLSQCRVSQSSDLRVEEKGFAAACSTGSYLVIRGYSLTLR